MSIREYMNNNPAVATIGVVVLLVIALGFLVMTLMGGGGGGGDVVVKVTYFDLGTGKVILADSSEFPPFDTGSGTQPDGSYNGVLMKVWTCDSCIPLKDMVGMTPEEIEAVEGKSMFISHLVKFDPDAHRLWIQSEGQVIPGTDTPAPKPTTQIEAGRMVRTLTGKWVYAESEKGEYLIKKVLSPKCPGNSYPKPCLD